MRGGLHFHARSLSVGYPHAFGIAVPLVLAGDHALATTPYAVLGGLAGFVAAGLPHVRVSQ